MIKSIIDLQTLDTEVGIVLEIHKSFKDDIALLSMVNFSFGKKYVKQDIENLRRYHEFINQLGDFEGLKEFTLKGGDTIMYG